jgi:hypothetical protein
VSPRYFATVGTKVEQGRDFAESDNRTAPNVAIVDEAFVRRYLHGENPIGAHFGDSDPASTGMFTIVGVVEDAQYWPPNDPQEAGHPMYFLPAGQWAQPAATTQNAVLYAQFVTNTHYMGTLEIETHGAVPDLEARVRSVLASLNPNLMVTRYRSFEEQVKLGFTQQELIVRLTSLFGAVALALAAIGLYGVTAYAVAQRTSEIGIRMALGADRVHVQAMVLRGAALQAGLGLLIGIPAAIGAGHLMAAELFGVSAWNPMVLGVTTLMLAVVVLVAASLPARRAAGVEPMEALRGE